MQHIVQEMLLAGALPASQQVYTFSGAPAELLTLRRMEEIELVACIAADGHTSQWRLTKECIGILESHIQLTTPRPALQVRSLPLHELFTWELLQLCASQGPG